MMSTAASPGGPFRSGGVVMSTTGRIRGATNIGQDGHGRAVIDNVRYEASWDESSQHYIIYTAVAAHEGGGTVYWPVYVLEVSTSESSAGTGAWTLTSYAAHGGDAPTSGKWSRTPQSR